MKVIVFNGLVFIWNIYTEVDYIIYVQYMLKYFLLFRYATCIFFQELSCC